MQASAKETLAVTGATGFVGRHFIKECVTAGIPVKALTRGPQPQQDGVQWVRGDLHDEAALSDLLGGASCLVHLAGATKALHREDFQKINADATANLSKLAQASGIGHFVFLSSLAATRPDVSPYAASKAAAEKALWDMGGDMKITVIRAPAVLGPGDSATYPLFSNLAKGILAVPGTARATRFSVIDVEDLSALLIALVTTRDSLSKTVAPYGHARLDWTAIAQSASRILDRRVRTLYLPSPVAALVAHAVDIFARLSGKAQVLSADKLGEINAGDWIAEHPVDAPVPLDETMQRCLAPFMTQKTNAA